MQTTPLLKKEILQWFINHYVKLNVLHKSACIITFMTAALISSAVWNMLRGNSVLTRLEY